MSYYIDDQNEIVPVEIGLAANDNKGDFIRISFLKLNTNIKLIRDWINASNGSPALNNPLPIVRGGTGSATAQGARTTLGLGLVDCNGVIRKAESSIEIHDDRIVKGPYASNNMQNAIIKNSTGNYTVSGITEVNKWVLPFDELGQPKYIVEVNSLNSVTKDLVISVYAPIFESGSGWVKGPLIDIPLNTPFTLLAT